MAGINNKKVVRDAFKEFEYEVNDKIFDTLDEICYNLLLDAVIRNREENVNAHQFTGNLINSIVVILFRRATGEQYNYFAFDRLKAPIRREMSAKTSRGTFRKNRIHFRQGDWQHRPSSYLPEVVTDESFGPQDARGFAAMWKPSTGKNFEICVAYTSEYAEWVEIHHHSTGFLNSMRFTKQVMAAYSFKKM